MKKNEVVLSPVGRLVSGNIFKPNYDENIKWEKGPNKGEQKPSYYIGVAFEKQSGVLDDIIKKIRQVAAASFPDKFDTTGKCIAPRFSFKIDDGDSDVPNTVGNKNCDRQGYPGNWILNFSTSYPFPVTTQDGKGYITDDQLIKKGDYIRVAFNIQSNFFPSNPGVKLYQQAVIFFDKGEEIHQGIDVSRILSDNPVSVLPQGVSSTPSAVVAPANNFLDPGSNV